MSKSIINVIELPKGVYLVRFYNQSNQSVMVKKNSD